MAATAPEPLPEPLRKRPSQGVGLDAVPRNDNVPRGVPLSPTTLTHLDMIGVASGRPSTTGHAARRHSTEAMPVSSAFVVTSMSDCDLKGKGTWKKSASTTEDIHDGLPVAAVVQGSMGNAVPAGNCRRFKANSLFSKAAAMMYGKKINCVCGFPQDAPCHNYVHRCQICKAEFTANTNSDTSCLKHPFDTIRIVGAHAHAVHKYKTYIYECCPDKPQNCSSEEAFREKGVPHGYHV